MNGRGMVGKQSQLSGLMGSTFTALDSEVQNGKEKGEGRALPAHTAQASQAWGQPARASGLWAFSLPPHPEGPGWVEIWPKLLSSLSPAQLNWGNWYRAPAWFHHWQLGEELCIPTVQWGPRKTPAVGWESVWDGLLRL